MNKMSPYLINESRKALYIPIDDKEYTVTLTRYIPANTTMVCAPDDNGISTTKIVKFEEDDDFMDIIYKFVEAMKFKNVKSFSFIVEFKTDDVILKVRVYMNEEERSENKIEQFIIPADEIIRYWMVCNIVDVVSKARSCKSIDDIMWDAIDMHTFAKIFIK